MDSEKKALRAESTKRKIIDAYVELLSSKECSRFSMNSLFEKANIHKSTFYRHFENIEAVQIIIEESVVLKFKSILSSSNLCDIMHGRRRFLELLNLEIKNDLDFYTKLVSVNQSMSFLERIKDEILAELKSSAEKEHSFTSFQINLFYTYTIAGRIAVYREWIQNGCRESVDELLLALEVISSSGIEGFISTD